MKLEHQDDQDEIGENHCHILPLVWYALMEYFLMKTWLLLFYIKEYTKLTKPYKALCPFKNMKNILRNQEEIYTVFV